MLAQMMKTEATTRLNRRDFMASLTVGPMALAAQRTVSAQKRIAVTMDDPNTTETPRLSAGARNWAILRTLDRAKLKAALFVCGMRVDQAEGAGLLRQWDEQGHLLGNHTYSHLYLHGDDISLQYYLDDIARCQELLEAWPRFQPIFRFPLLKEGDTVKKRDGVRKFLSERGYRVGHVTIDNSDWYVDQRLRAMLEKDPEGDATPYRDFYLRHLWERAAFYDTLANEVLGRQIPHTLLIHHNLLNALFLQDVLRMFEERGWIWIDAERAYQDEVFSESPNIMPAGESIVWALAKQMGRFDARLRYPGEDGEYEEEAMDRLGL